MKLFVLTIFAVGIGCSWATIPLPPGNQVIHQLLLQINFKYFVQNTFLVAGCGDAFVQAADAMKPRLNIDGRNGVNQLKEGIKQLKRLIVFGDVNGQAANLRDPGAVGMRKLATTTADSCLQRVFLLLADKDEQVAWQITGCDPNTSANLVCNLLNYKAKRIQQCLRIPVCQ